MCGEVVLANFQPFQHVKEAPVIVPLGVVRKFTVPKKQPLANIKIN